jgi:hypothetical protein
MVTDPTMSWNTPTTHVAGSFAAGISGTSVTNIIGNGNNVYYDATLSGNSALAGKTYSLVSVGSLLPKGTSDVAQLETGQPLACTLLQNYPNPFNPSTKIGFRVWGLGSAGVRLAVYDVLGREVAVLVNENKEPGGDYTVTWNAGGMASGVYLYRLEIHSLDPVGNSASISGSGGFAQTRQLVLLR